MEPPFFNRKAQLALAAATVALASPVAAQPFASYSLGKSDAILGAPSQLAAIMAAQSSGAAVAVSARMPISRATFAARPTTLFNLPPAPKIALAASPSRPDIFNSVAMPVAHTALDARWARVGTASVGGHAARFASALRGHDERARLEAVNDYVNAHVTFTNDSRQFGIADRWSAANDTLARGRGDCEDYALAKLAMLRRAGFADRDLYFVILKDLGRRADHAVLVVRSEGRFLVLDNGTSRLIDSAYMRDYRPVLTFTAGQRFVHGYRRSAAPPMVLASYQPARPPALISASATPGMPSSPFASR